MNCPFDRAFFPNLWVCKVGVPLKKLRLFFYNGCLLTATALIMRSISMTFQVYLSDRLGAAGMGLFTLIMSVYGFAVTLATSGNHLATVRLVSAALAQNNEQHLAGAVRRCLWYSLLFSSFACVLLYFGAPILSAKVLCDLRCVRALRILALGLPFMSCSSCIYGYFHAVRRVSVGAAMQAIEQIFYMGATVALLHSFLPKGLEYACIAVVLGSCLSDVMGCITTVILLRRDRKKHRLQAGYLPTHQTKMLVSIALPVAFSAYARSALITIEHILIPKGLRAYGNAPETALESYGILHGMALPTVLFAQVFLASFSSLLVPEFSESYAKREWGRIRSMSERVFALLLPFSIGVAAFLLCFADELGDFLFHQSQAATYIRYLAPLVPVMYLDTATDQMLKGINEQFYSMQINIADATLSVIGVALLLPRFGLISYFWIIYVCELLNAVCSVAKLLQRTKMRPPLLRYGYLPLLASVGSVALLHLVQGLMQQLGQTHLDAKQLVLLSGCFVFFYLAFLFLLRVWKKEDLLRAKRVLLSA